MRAPNGVDAAAYSSPVRAFMSSVISLASAG